MEIILKFAQIVIVMKKNPALFGLLASIFVFLGAFGIYFLFLAKKNEYLVDNPSDKTFYFKINNTSEKIIAPGQFLKIDLEMGQNRIQVFDDTKKPLFDSAFNVKKVRGLVNISHSDYYINTQYYGYDLNKDSLLVALGKTMIDGKPYFGAPKKMNKIYSDDFYYNVDEQYDRVIKNIDKIESRSKIFRKQDYFNYYKEYYNF